MAALFKINENEVKKINTADTVFYILKIKAYNFYKENKNIQ